MTAKKPTDGTKSNNEIDAYGQEVSILIVDDHPAMRSTMYDILEDEGLSPMVAANGEEAISLCMENEFDFVLMDVQMPDIHRSGSLSKNQEGDTS